ncbi:uncharacterized protein LOC131609214 [Vicia villosa]|uniref:uncharacterized protein LOC131609214 n=1 Tax=Vicia villosa TaxID=3911 RepID=UPI00273ABC73|nr:uncharacterized protein LOC131609214 [Vicia villosa]XP_058736853.1 uncharacterized protein LOC131609214 [Vicia villosa]XP_058736854.1 uncharacterized protein LOC131609214 [Vicia villosa]XP_058736855.1 uncharacterized protein LOC131609214 [Vicia villosa]XP_058736856.1 uncharacterized protein LOC131609214 [Vicia villosa]XP_058736857.1 uncharacterized protein LOC131609214 [Vicia villosa]
MGGGSILSSNGIHEDFHFPRDDDLGLEDEGNRVNENNGLDFEQVSVENAKTSSCTDSVVSERKKGTSIDQEILQSFNELKIDSESLKKGKKKILRYRPGTWIWKARGLKVCDYDVPETTCLILVGPSQSGKSSLINRISKVFDDDKFAPARAQVSYNSLGNGTCFLHEYMIPRNSNSICLYDTRSLSDNSHENNQMLKNWMTKGVRHGEFVLRTTDDPRLSESLRWFKGDKKGSVSDKSRKVNSVIYVLDGLSILNTMKTGGGGWETPYIKMVVSSFNCPFLSFKDDKPVLVFTHGDLLSLSDRARVRAYLGDLLEIPPTTQIFDIPDCDGPETESAITGMLRHTLEHADRNFPLKPNVMNKVFKISAFLFMILLILGIEIAVGSAQNKFMNQCHAPQSQGPQPQACSSEVHEMHPNLKVPKKKPKIKRPKQKVSDKEPKIEWHKIRHIW